MDANALARLKQLAGKQTLILTHYGRKSGKPYEVKIWFVVDGGQGVHRDREREPPVGAQRPKDAASQALRRWREVRGGGTVPW